MRLVVFHAHSYCQEVHLALWLLGLFPTSEGIQLAGLIDRPLAVVPLDQKVQYFIKKFRESPI